jgi:hypothetical protein
MARRRAHEADADASKPKQLRKRLRKAEDQLADAQVKRDRAQARVEALGIIADEIRAQLAALEKAAAATSPANDAAAGPKPQLAARTPRASTPKTGTRTRSAGKAASSTRKSSTPTAKGTASSASDAPSDVIEQGGSTPAAKPATSRAAVKPRSTTASTRRTSATTRSTTRKPRGSSTGRGRTSPPTP